MIKITSKKKIYIFAGLILSVIVTALAGAFITDLPKYYALKTSGSEIKGTLISKEEHNHQFVEVDYSINNINYIVKGNAENFGRDFYSVKVGDIVPVTYNPHSPNDACLGNPEAQLNKSIRGTFSF